MIQLLEQQEALLVREHLLVGVFDDVLGVTAGERGYGCHLVNAHRLHLARDGFDELLDLVLRAVPKQRDHEEATVLRLAHGHDRLHDFLDLRDSNREIPL